MVPLFTPDGLRYLQMGDGHRCVRPFHYRWLLPVLCGTDYAAWRFTAQLAAVTLPVAAWWYAGGGIGGLWVAAVPFGLSGVTRFNLRWPVMVDLPAMTLALVCASLTDDRIWPAVVVVTFVSATVKESAPVYAALWAWHPLPLVGLAAVAIRHLQHEGTDADHLDRHHHWLVKHPFRAGWRSNRKASPTIWVLPWGACLAGLANPTWPVAATVLAAYATCWIATDYVRLYQWAWPVLAVAAVQNVPRGWLIPILAVHLVNPYATEGL